MGIKYEALTKNIEKNFKLKLCANDDKSIKYINRFIKDKKYIVVGEAVYLISDIESVGDDVIIHCKPLDDVMFVYGLDVQVETDYELDMARIDFKATSVDSKPFLSIDDENYEVELKESIVVDTNKKESSIDKVFHYVASVDLVVYINGVYTEIVEPLIDVNDLVHTDKQDVMKIGNTLYNRNMAIARIVKELPQNNKVVEKKKGLFSFLKG